MPVLGMGETSLMLLLLLLQKFVWRGRLPFEAFATSESHGSVLLRTAVMLTNRALSQRAGADWSDAASSKIGLLIKPCRYLWMLSRAVPRRCDTASGLYDSANPTSKESLGCQLHLD